MKAATRFAIIGTSVLLCVGGILTVNLWREGISNSGTGSESIDATTSDDGYRFAASGSRPKLTFQQLETIIRGDPVAKSQRGRMEFGSVRMEEGTALAEVVFVSNDGRVLPFLYKLLPERDSWKIVNVQRMWYVPRSHLLRGVRA
jgi:hypothetical protein